MKKAPTLAPYVAALSDADLCAYIARHCENPYDQTLESLASSRHQHESQCGPKMGCKRWRAVTEKLARIHGGEAPVKVWKDELHTKDE